MPISCLWLKSEEDDDSLCIEIIVDISLNLGRRLQARDPLHKFSFTFSEFVLPSDPTSSIIHYGGYSLLMHIYPVNLSVV